MLQLEVGSLPTTTNSTNNGKKGEALSPIDLSSLAAATLGSLEGLLRLLLRISFSPGICPLCLHVRLILMMFRLLLLWSNATLLSSTFAYAQPCCSSLEHGGFYKLQSGRHPLAGCCLDIMIPHFFKVDGLVLLYGCWLMLAFTSLVAAIYKLFVELLKAAVGLLLYLYSWSRVALKMFF
ncbi:hypothetical protein NC651_039877 [Populus alba x Populus x berolinensis]|nr:hypothetical protein NC651_039877 [Populus alba x Populus x berolinensis]